MIKWRSAWAEAKDDKLRPCAVCGFGPNRAVHLPPYGAPKDAEPWGHRWMPLPEPPKDKP